MEPREDLVSPDAFLSLEDVRAHLQKESTTEDWVLARAINWATSILETKTRRQLKERVYMAPSAALSCTVTMDLKTVTSAALFGPLRAGEDVLGATVRFGSRVDTITNTSTLALTVDALGPTGATTLTFRRGVAKMKHDHGIDLLLPESPVSAIYTVRVLEADGAKTDVSIAKALLDQEAGILTLVDDAVRRDAWLEIEMKAGYRKPSSVDIGHAREWARLEHLSMRIVECLFQEHKHQLGRSIDAKSGDGALRFLSLDLPADVLDGVREFEREQI